MLLSVHVLGKQWPTFYNFHPNCMGNRSNGSLPDNKLNLEGTILEDFQKNLPFFKKNPKLVLKKS